MAMLTTPKFMYPHPTSYSAGTAPSIQNSTLDATGEYIASVLNPPKNGTITKIHIRMGTVTTPGDLDVRLETVDATTGMPTGTLAGTNTNIVIAISAATAWYTATLTAGLVVTSQDRLAIVCRWVSGSYIVMSFRQNIASGFPYRVLNTGTPTKASTTENLITGIEYNDGTFSYSPNVPQAILVSSTMNTGTTPDEIGNLFTVPVGMRVCGFYGYTSFAQDLDVVLYQGSTALVTYTLERDEMVTTNVTVERLFTPVTLAANTSYRLVWKATSGSSTTIYSWQAPTAAAREGQPGALDWQKTSRADAGSWSETNTDYVILSLLVDGIDAGGGLLVHRGMTGGMNG